MPRLPQRELDELKRNVSLATLAGSQGHRLLKQGRDLRGDAHRGGSVFRQKKCVGAKSCCPESAAGKTAVTDCLHRKKGCSPSGFASDNVVVENNALSDGFQLPKGSQTTGWR